MDLEQEDGPNVGRKHMKQPGDEEQANLAAAIARRAAAIRPKTGGKPPRLRLVAAQDRAGAAAFRKKPGLY